MLSSPWIYTPNPQPRPRLRLFCIPYAGGSAAAFRAWPAGLPADVEVNAIQLPGRMERYREPPLPSLGPLVTSIANAIKPALTDAPFAFFGHSMGALLAFEVTRLLRRREADMPVHLFVSAALPPGAKGRSRGLSTFSDARLAEALRLMGGLPDAVLRDRDLLAMMLKTSRADLKAFETWSPPEEAPLEVPITALGGITDPHPTADRLVEWRPETNATFRTFTFPGGHFYITPSMAPLLEVIR